MAQIAARFARSVAEIHEKIPCKLPLKPTTPHLSAEFHDHYTQVAHEIPRLLWHEVTLQCHASCLAGFAFHGFHAGTWWPKASSHRTHSRLNMCFSSPHISKNSLLMIDRNESKMTYPPCRFQQSLQHWHAVQKSVPGIATVGVGAVSGKSTSSSSSATRSREPSRNGTGQPPTAEF